MYSFIPFILIFALNLILVRFVYRKKVVNSTGGESRAKFKSMTRTVMSITIIFIVMTSPISVASIFYNELVLTYLGLICLDLLNSLCFTYHALNIFILLFTNKKFVTELKQFLTRFCCFKFDLVSKVKDHTNSSTQSNTQVRIVQKTVT
jgi:hypothetical protein